MGPILLVLCLLAQAHLLQSESVPVAVQQNPAQSVIKVLSSNGIPISLPAERPTPYPGQMSMLSIYAGSDEQSAELEVLCKADRSMSNIDVNIPIFGIVQEDVVSVAGKILIPAGSRVFGQGYCSTERARLLGRGRWTFYLSDHQIATQGMLRDSEKREGLAGQEISEGLDESRVKQAIYRDGIYLYVPAETEFTLRLKGAISVEDLPSAFGK
jgi:hypothetical protein